MNKWEQLPDPEPGYIPPKRIQQLHPPLKLPDGERITVITILRKGYIEFNDKEFDIRYVKALKNGFDRFLTNRPFDFVCLTDSVKEVSKIPGVIPMELSNSKLTSKYCKFEIHRLDIHERLRTNQIFYLDLDTLITGNLNTLFSFGGNFACLKHPFLKGFVMGGFLSFRRKELSYLYNKFVCNLEENMKHYPIYKGRGDQLWMYRHCKYIPLYWDDLYPDEIVVNWRRVSQKDINKTKIIFFSGNDTPDKCKDHKLVKDFWNYEISS